MSKRKTFAELEFDACQREIERLRLALDEIANPLKYMEQRARERGDELNAAAPGICDNVNYVKQIARDALAATPTE
jgi:hypothetical protein